MKIVIIIGIVLVVLIVLGWAGLQVQPRPFPAYPAPSVDVETVPLPDDLPAPVARFYGRVYGDTYGDRIPVITSAVVSGLARMRVMGLTFPTRLRFTYVAGQAYRHYIEATWFGLPIMRINEHYIDGESRMELPFGVTEDEPQVNQAANLGLWSETFWMPAVFLTDPRVRWEAVDATTALLRVPFGGDEQTFVVRFDPDTGLVRLITSMRYKGAESTSKTLWLNEVRAWERINGLPTMAVAALIWLDEGSPWAVIDVDEIVYNADVSDYVRATGP